MLLVLKTPSNLKDWYLFAAEPTEAMGSRIVGFKKNTKNNIKLSDCRY